jgi:tetratricopeptide (TPR) repeat protein
MKQKLSIALLLLAMSLQPAAADLIDECRGHAWPDVQLRACTEIITSPSFGIDARALAYRYRGDARTDAGAFERAIADFSDSIRLRPDNVPAFAGRGRAEFSMRNLDDALGDYSEAIRLSPATANLYIARGHVYLAQGNVDASIRDLTEAIKLDPKSATAFNNRGLALRKKGDLDAAMQDYSTAIAINPIYALAYENRGYLQEARGQRNDAIGDLRQALLLDPSLVGARDALRRLGSWQAIASEKRSTHPRGTSSGRKKLQRLPRYRRSRQKHEWQRTDVSQPEPPIYTSCAEGAHYARHRRTARSNAAVRAVE